MLDVRGLSCPEPVIVVKKALRLGPPTVQVLADSRVSVENIRKMAGFMKYAVCVEAKDDEFVLTLTSRQEK